MVQLKSPPAVSLHSQSVISTRFLFAASAPKHTASSKTALIALAVDIIFIALLHFSKTLQALKSSRLGKKDGDRAGHRPLVIHANPYAFIQTPCTAKSAQDLQQEGMCHP
jgi:hypothetical protein